MEKNEKTWISVHLFFKGDIYSNHCDKIILEVIDTFINKFKSEKIIEKFFFVRYNELGSHMRLRLYGDKKILNDQVIKMFEQHIVDSFPLQLFNIPYGIETDKNYLWIDYEPEIDRYGGKYGITIAEDFFYYSTLCSIKLIKTMVDGDSSDRLGKGLVSMLVLLYIFFEDQQEASVFIHNYGKNYIKPFAKNEKEIIQLTNAFNNGFYKQSESMIKYTLTIWEALQEDIDINPILNLYKNKLLCIKNNLFDLQNKNLLSWNSHIFKNWNISIHKIIPSYIHMMNNRLGISIKDESYLAHILHRSLENVNSPI